MASHLRENRYTRPRQIPARTTTHEQNQGQSSSTQGSPIKLARPTKNRKQNKTETLPENMNKTKNEPERKRKVKLTEVPRIPPRVSARIGVVIMYVSLVLCPVFHLEFSNAFSCRNQTHPRVLYHTPYCTSRRSDNMAITSKGKGPDG